MSSPELPPPLCFTLTTAAFPRMTVWAGSGDTTAFLPYMVEATLFLAYDVRSDIPEYVESLRSPGMKKCSCSYLGELEAEDSAIGMGGTGGTRRPGVDGADLFVTPGIYAI